MSLLRNCVLASLGFLAVGCASTVHRGVVAMKMNENKAHVGIGSKEVSVGDHVELYRSQCKNDAPGNKSGSVGCVKKGLGHGIVTSVLSTDYSEVAFDKGVEFREGDTVEKHAH